jgi:hypothetical protein
MLTGTVVKQLVRCVLPCMCVVCWLQVRERAAAAAAAGADGSMGGGSVAQLFGQASSRPGTSSSSRSSSSATPMRPALENYVVSRCVLQPHRCSLHCRHPQALYPMHML